MNKTNSRASSGEDKNWTEIEIKVDGDETLNVPDNLEETVNEQQESQNLRRESRRSDQTSEREEDDQVRSEEQESEEEREVRESQARVGDNSRNVSNLSQTRLPRAERRIRSLISTNKELSNQLQQLHSTIEALKVQNRKAETTSVKSQASQWKTIVEDKQRALKKAVEENDAEGQAKLITEISDANVKLNAYQAVANELTDEETENSGNENNTRVERNSPQVQEEVPEATLDWVERNPWFRTDRKLHLMAREITREMIEEGEDPRKEQFYQELDNRMKETGLKLPGNTQNQGEQRRRTSSPVASRETGDDPGRGNAQFRRTGNTVTGSPTQEDKEMAETLGVPLKKYLENKYLYQKQDNRGWSEIKIG